MSAQMAMPVKVPPPRTALDQALTDCRSAFGVVGLFSLIINLLMLTQPIYMLQVYDRVLGTGRLETLTLLSLLAAAAFLMLALLDALRTMVTVRIGCWLHEKLGPILLGSGVRSRLAGDVSGAQQMRDLQQIQTFISTQGLSVFFDAPWVPVFVLLTWVLHPLLGMMALGAAFVLLALSLANEAVTRKATLTANLAQIAATSQAEATIRNAEVVRAMGMLPAMTTRWQTLSRTARLSLQGSAEQGGIVMGATKFIRFTVQAGVLGMGSLLVIRGELSPGAMIAASILLGRALAPVELAMTAWRNFTTTRIAYDRLRSRLVASPPEPARLRLPAPSGRIAVTGVTFITPVDRRIILNGVSMIAEPGEAIAIVGPSAAGKSTLTRLLVGIAAPTAGKIRLDGSELLHWDPVQLGRHIGYLPQDVELFAGTVRENIARMDRGEDEAVIRAAMLAHAHEMIQQLQDGYETQVGEGGIRLSGGQKQRIGLARAVYGDPKLIVLDEPNANLDQVGEAALAAAVGELKQRGAALIIVGHRPSTLAQADKVLLLKDGRVELFGPRDEVLQTLREAAAASGKPGAVPIQKHAAATGGELARREGEKS